MPMRNVLLIIFVFMDGVFAYGKMIIAKEGQPRCVIVESVGATDAEQFAITELALHLKLITGAEFKVETNATKAPEKCHNRRSKSARGQSCFPEIDFREPWSQRNW